MWKLFKKRGAAGFTLIELLVVIAIIGVLASIVLASLNNARRKSRDARRITDIKQIQLALELFFDGQGNQYPIATATCTTPPTTADGESRGLQALPNRGYIPQVPRDPNGGCYSYASPTAPATRTVYHLGGVLEDITNQALGSDADFSSVTGYDFGFHGLSNAAATPCGTVAGTAQPGGTETCYDVRP